MGIRKADAEKAATLQARRTRERLKRSKVALENFLHRLEVLHADKSGAFRFAYMRTPLLTDEAIPTQRSTAKTEREAGAGCTLCAEWLTDTAEMRARIDHLRHTPLPEKEPGYSGPWIMPHRAYTAGKRRRVCVTGGERRDVAELLAEREERRRAREAEVAELLGLIPPRSRRH